MLDPYLTLESVIALNPCHAPETIQAWYPDRTRVRLSTVMRDSRIEHAERISLAVRVLPHQVVDRWLTVVVERSIRRSLGTSGCTVWEEWAAAWLDGTDRTEASAWAAWAMLSARAVTVGAAWAARAAAAAWAAAEAWEARATYAALEARAAAWAAAAAAAWAAERDQQIADLLEIMKTDKETNHA